MPLELIDPPDQEDREKENGNGNSLNDGRSLKEKFMEAANSYTKESDKINSYERNSSLCDSHIPSNEIAQIVAFCEVLKIYLGKARLPSNLTLYRGTSLNYLSETFSSNHIGAIIFLEDCEQLTDTELTEKYKNSLFTYNQFVSTTRNCDRAYDFAIDKENPCILEIYAPEGTPGMDISVFSAYATEAEILLNTNTKFRIDYFETDSMGYKYIHICVVLNQNSKNYPSPSNDTGYNTNTNPSVDF